MNFAQLVVTPSLPTSFSIHQLQLPPGCHVKNVRHPQQRRRMQQHRMLHQPTNGELDHSRGFQHQRQQGQNTPFGQLLHQMRQQRQHQAHSGHRQHESIGNASDQIQGTPHHHRHQQHRMHGLKPKEVGNHIEDPLSSVVQHTPRRPMQRQWLRNHPSKWN